MESPYYGYFGGFPQPKVKWHELALVFYSFDAAGTLTLTTAPTDTITAN
jgi:hypothetical protein